MEIEPRVADGLGPAAAPTRSVEDAVAAGVPAVEAAAVVSVVTPPSTAPMVAEPPTGILTAAEAPSLTSEDLMQEAVSLASAAAAEGRQALASLPPIPPIAAVERTQQNFRRSRQAELAELVEAQAQLRHDLERLQMAKMRLQQARRVHESKKQSTGANAAAAVQAEGAHWSNGVGSEAAQAIPSAPSDAQTGSQGPPPARGRSR